MELKEGLLKTQQSNMWTIIAKWIGHWLVYLILSVIVGWIVYAGLIRPVTKPNPSTTVQSGGVANTWNIKLGAFSCARIPGAEKR